MWISMSSSLGSQHSIRSAECWSRCLSEREDVKATYKQLMRLFSLFEHGYDFSSKKEVMIEYLGKDVFLLFSGAKVVTSREMFFYWKNVKKKMYYVSKDSCMLL